MNTSIWRFTILLAGFLQASAAACVANPYFDLRDSDRTALNIALAERPDINLSNFSIGKMQGYGHTSPTAAVIEVWPTLNDSTIREYFEVWCNLSSNAEWQCDRVVSKTGMMSVATSDHIETGEMIDARTARRVVEFVRNSIVIDAAGRYRFDSGDGQRTSSRPLDIASVRYGRDFQHFDVEIRSGDPCSVHSVIVREVDCESEDCELVLEDNTLYWRA